MDHELYSQQFDHSLFYIGKQGYWIISRKNFKMLPYNDFKVCWL